MRRRVVIVGAGLAGAATAWHLARRGLEDVVLLEQEQTPGRHASGRNASLVREYVADPAWSDLTQAGAAFLRTAGLASFARNGSLLIGLGDTPVERFVPSATGRALHSPGDGIVDVAGLLHAYLRGRDVRTSVRYEGHHPSGRGIRVETSAGPLEADVVVNAAGAWAGSIGGLPLVPLGRHLFVSTEDPAIDPRWPFVWDVREGLYFRPESGGWLLSACDETPGTPGDYTVDEEVGLLVAERVARLQPGLGDLRLQHEWLGYRTFAPDRRPVIGFDARDPHLFHVAGLGGHGVTTSWPVGRIAADLLLGAAAHPAPGLDPRRMEVDAASPGG